MVDVEYTTNDTRLPEPSGQEVFSIDAAIAKADTLLCKLMIWSVVRIGATM